MKCSKILIQFLLVILLISSSLVLAKDDEKSRFIHLIDRTGKPTGVVTPDKDNIEVGKGAEIQVYNVCDFGNGKIIGSEGGGEVTVGQDTYTLTKGAEVVIENCEVKSTKGVELPPEDAIVMEGKLISGSKISMNFRSKELSLDRESSLNINNANIRTRNKVSVKLSKEEYTLSTGAVPSTVTLTEGKNKNELVIRPRGNLVVSNEGEIKRFSNINVKKKIRFNGYNISGLKLFSDGRSIKFEKLEIAGRKFKIPSRSNKGIIRLLDKNRFKVEVSKSTRNNVYLLDERGEIVIYFLPGSNIEFSKDSDSFIADFGSTFHNGVVRRGILKTVIKKEKVMFSIGHGFKDSPCEKDNKLSHLCLSKEGILEGQLKEGAFVDMVSGRLFPFRSVNLKKIKDLNSRLSLRSSSSSSSNSFEFVYDIDGFRANSPKVPSNFIGAIKIEQGDGTVRVIDFNGISSLSVGAKLGRILEGRELVSFRERELKKTLDDFKERGLFTKKFFTNFIEQNLRGIDGDKRKIILEQISNPYNNINWKNAKEYTKIVKNNINDFDFITKLISKSIYLSKYSDLLKLRRSNKNNYPNLDEFLLSLDLRRLDIKDFEVSFPTLGLNDLSNQDRFFELQSSGMVIDQEIIDFALAYRKHQLVRDRSPSSLYDLFQAVSMNPSYAPSDIMFPVQELAESYIFYSHFDRRLGERGDAAFDIYFRALKKKDLETLDAFKKLVTQRDILSLSVKNMRLEVNNGNALFHRRNSLDVRSFDDTKNVLNSLITFSRDPTIDESSRLAVDRYLFREARSFRDTITALHSQPKLQDKLLENIPDDFLIHIMGSFNGLTTTRWGQINFPAVFTRILEEANGRTSKNLLKDFAKLDVDTQSSRMFLDTIIAQRKYIPLLEKTDQETKKFYTKHLLKEFGSPTSPLRTSNPSRELTSKIQSLTLFTDLLESKERELVVREIYDDYKKRGLRKPPRQLQHLIENRKEIFMRVLTENELKVFDRDYSNGQFPNFESDVKKIVENSKNLPINNFVKTIMDTTQRTTRQITNSIYFNNLDHHLERGFVKLQEGRLKNLGYRLESRGTEIYNYENYNYNVLKYVKTTKGKDQNGKDIFVDEVVYLYPRHPKSTDPTCDLCVNRGHGGSGSHLLKVFESKESKGQKSTFVFYGGCGEYKGPRASALKKFPNHNFLSYSTACTGSAKINNDLGLIISNLIAKAASEGKTITSLEGFEKEIDTMMRERLNRLRDRTNLNRWECYVPPSKANLGDVYKKI